ncbi:hypothetical protein KSD_23080 [Ktedonobacter sp. SOSP1-85]|uniref:transglycosylase SLT domain-containing protein n=1 Tax=Ktedonobacter sp. SOSP1-85 TaxID=2778367 RepID=UPI0019159275|nr:transglycosylase SLT domain-containing protein [Ktedonobacter sp. SOSP1-85]GHO74537.1 hypothetical protein KSD_23080 [Ktedonobacter sp. SOSP1-85]
MSQFRSLPSFSRVEGTSTDEVTTERPLHTNALFPPITSAAAGDGVNTQSVSAPNTTTLPPQYTGSLAPAFQPGTTTTGPIQPASTRVLYDVATTQALVTSALQSAPERQTAAAKYLVIPGKKPRASRRTTTLLPESERHTEDLKPVRKINSQLRYAIVLGALCGVVLTSLLSLTPLGGGQTSNPLTDLMNLAQSPSNSWNVSPHQEDKAANPPQSGGVPAGIPSQLSTNQYVQIAREAAAKYGINPDYFVNQIYSESSFNPNAVSPAGAVGIAQFLPSTAAGLGFNPWDPVQALYGAAKYMAQLRDQWGGDYAKALASYNAGSGTVQNAINQGGANWMNFLPAETRNYLTKIMGI